MRAIQIPTPGGPEVLTETLVEDLPVGDREIRIRVAAAGVNRADVAQRQGNYPSPPGAPAWPGLEVSGVVTETGPGVTRFVIGDRVCALLAGGGYADEAVAHEDLALTVPESLDLIAAAALPEALATVVSNVFLSAHLTAGETVLIHGGSSGIGTTAIQLAVLAGARVAVTAGSTAKLEACRRLGAEILINYKDSDFVAELNESTGGSGADVILDIVGGDYLNRNIRALAVNGRIMVIANQSQLPATISIFPLMAKRGQIWGTTLRSRPFVEKAQIMEAVRSTVWPWVESGQFQAVIDRRFPLSEAADAHRRLESSEHVGKIVLIP